jgi:hypothetical protein
MRPEGPIARPGCFLPARSGFVQVTGQYLVNLRPDPGLSADPGDIFPGQPDLAGLRGIVPRVPLRVMCAAPAIAAIASRYHAVPAPAFTAIAMVDEEPARSLGHA